MEVDDPGTTSTPTETLETDWFGRKSRSPKSSSESPDSLSIAHLYYRMIPISTPTTQRGRCLILNYDFFPQMTDGGRRRGSQRDVEALNQTFTSFGYHVLVHQNLSLRGTERILDSESEVSHREFDSLVLCVLTHGKEGDGESDNEEITVEQIISKLTADRIPGLAGKPKLLFIQACRGEGLDPGVQLVVDGPGGSQEVEPMESEAQNLVRLPTHADFLVFRSTYSGYYSFRNSLHGSWFIQDLTSTFDRYAAHLDLLTLLTLVCREVAFKRESRIPFDEQDDEETRKRKVEMNEKKVMPVFTSTLTRLVKFYKVR